MFFRIDLLATENEKKFLLALQKALKDKYLIHCQTSLIAMVDPVNFKDKPRAYSKRMDFVITDTATKILAVIELEIVVAYEQCINTNIDTDLGS